MGAGGAVAGVQGAGAVLGAYGSYQQGIAQENYNKYLAKNSRTEATLALNQGDQESKLAQDSGLQETVALNRRVAQTEGSQRAEAGANGVAGSVTAADIQTDTAQKSLLDQMSIRYKADRASWEAKNNAALKVWALNRQASEFDSAAVGARRGAKIGAFNSLLSGAGQVASTAYSGRMSAPSKVG